MVYLPEGFLLNSLTLPGYLRSPCYLWRIGSQRVKIEITVIYIYIAIMNIVKHDEVSPTTCVAHWKEICTYYRFSMRMFELVGDC